MKREIKPQHLILPDGIDKENLEIVGYLQGDKVCYEKSLTFDFFHSVQFIRNSNNIINEREFMHMIGYCQNSKQFTVIIVKKK